MGVARCELCNQYVDADAVLLFRWKAAEKQLVSVNRDWINVMGTRIICRDCAGIVAGAWTVADPLPVPDHLLTQAERIDRQQAAVELTDVMDAAQAREYMSQRPYP